MQPILLYITTKDKPEALAIAQTLLAEKRIACANILPDITSVYEWEGRMQKENEVVLIAKTSPAAKTGTIRRISELHSYDCPCIIAFDSCDAHAPFAKWIFSQVRD